MKAFISVDLEGMPYITVPGHLSLKGTLYKEARKIATKVTLTAVEELKKNGFDQVIIADSHGPMVNLLVEDLPEGAEIIRGFLRPVSMVSGVKGCDAALFLGYHAKFGTARSTWDHTYSGRTVRTLKVNGVEVSEFLLNAYAAGEHNVPVVLVAGEAQLLEDDVRKHAPWIETVILKHSLSRVAARSASMTRIQRELREAIGKAATNLSRNKAKRLRAEKPTRVMLTFNASHFADAAELMPKVKRVDGLNVEYTASDILEAYKIFQLLVLAAAGTSAILTNLQ